MMVLRHGVIHGALGEAGKTKKQKEKGKLHPVEAQTQIRNRVMLLNHGGEMVSLRAYIDGGVIQGPVVMFITIFAGAGNGGIFFLI